MDPTSSTRSLISNFTEHRLGSRRHVKLIPKRFPQVSNPPFDNVRGESIGRRGKSGRRKPGNELTETGFVVYWDRDETGQSGAGRVNTGKSIRETRLENQARSSEDAAEIGLRFKYWEQQVCKPG